MAVSERGNVEAWETMTDRAAVRVEATWRILPDLRRLRASFALTLFTQTKPDTQRCKVQ
jgi:hypothetical protein